MITTEQIASILAGECPPVEEAPIPDWLADTIPGGGMNGFLMVRSRLTDRDDIELPDGFVWGETCEFGGTLYDVILHQRLHAVEYIHLTLRSPAHTPSGMSSFWNVSDVALPSLIRAVDSCDDLLIELSCSRPESVYMHAIVGPDGMVSCLARSRYDPQRPIWNQKRVLVRPGKFFRGLGLTDARVEYLTNLWNARFLPIEATFRMVEGVDVKRYYRENSYADQSETGTMGSSCMRYSRCESYLTVYSQNRHIVKLLILEKPDGKIIGRALVWKSDTGFTFMDRVYGNDLTQQRFIEYAQAQGWHSRFYQTYSHASMVRTPDGSAESITMRVKLNTRRIRRFPFMDTFFAVGDGFLTNDPDAVGVVARAQETDGGFEPLRSRYCRVCSSALGGLFDPLPDTTICDHCVERGWHLCPNCGYACQDQECYACVQQAHLDAPVTHRWSSSLRRYIGVDDPTDVVGFLSYVGMTQHGLEITRDSWGDFWIAHSGGCRPPIASELPEPIRATTQADSTSDIAVPENIREFLLHPNNLDNDPQPGYTL